MRLNLKFPLRTRALLRWLRMEVTRHDVPIPHLPPAFEGFRVVQVSDLHVDCWNTPLVEAAVETVNALKADLLVCTGDTIAEGREFLPEVASLLGRMRARHGKLACLGNHDYSDGDRGGYVCKALSRAGFDVLVNESTRLTLQHQALQLAGADDLILGRQCLASTSHRWDGALPTILLSHNPENFEAMARFQPDLILSGHTHGGQIHLPFGLHRKVMRSEFIAGMYRRYGSRLYVNRGLGSAVFVHHWERRRIAVPTPRLGVRPEISVFHLRAAAPSVFEGQALRRTS